MASYDMVLLFGGGMDSMSHAIWLAQEKKTVHLLHVDYGQKAAPGELKAMEKLTKQYKCLKPHTMKAPLIGFNSDSALLKGNTGKDYYLESRNLGLAYIASKFTANIMFCFTQDSTIQEYPDTSRIWCDAVSRVLSMGAKRTIMVYSPVIELDREDVVIEAMKLDPDLVMASHTCYHFPECGKCFRCKWKKTMAAALKQARKLK